MKEHKWRQLFNLAQRLNCRRIGKTRSNVLLCSKVKGLYLAANASEAQHLRSTYDIEAESIYNWERYVGKSEPIIIDPDALHKFYLDECDALLKENEKLKEKLGKVNSLNIAIKRELGFE